jgi:hypothetical protein
MFAALEVAVDVRLGQADFARNVGETDIFQSIFWKRCPAEEDRLLAFFDLGGAASPLEGEQFGSRHDWFGSDLTRDRWSLIQKINGLLRVDPVHCQA